MAIKTPAFQRMAGPPMASSVTPMRGPSGSTTALTPRLAISAATLYASVEWCRVSSKPNSSLRRSRVMTSVAEWTWART